MTDQTAAVADAAPDPNTTRLLVTITWDGDYYSTGERADVATDWIQDALDDRDDCPAVDIKPAHDTHDAEAERLRTELERASDVLKDARYTIDQRQAALEQATADLAEARTTADEMTRAVKRLTLERDRLAANLLRTTNLHDAKHRDWQRAEHERDEARTDLKLVTADRNRLANAVAAASAHHYPTGDPDTEGNVWCACDKLWPCATHTAIDLTVSPALVAQVAGAQESGAAANTEAGSAALSGATPETDASCGVEIF